MTARTPLSTSPLRNRHTLAGLAMTVVIGAIVTVSSWPIYGKPTVFIAAAAAIAAGIGVAYIAARRRWSLAVSAAVAVVTYLVVALAAAVPWIYRALPSSLMEGLTQVALGPVMSWKSLLTIALPVGDFGDTQIPLFLTLFVASLLAAYVIIDARRTWYLALIPLGVALLFPTVFGSSAAPETITIGSLTIPAYLHQIGGLAGFAALLGWPIMRGRSERKERVAAAQVEALPAASKREKRARRRMRLVAASMVVASVVAAAFATIPIAQWRARAVPRSTVANTVELPLLSNPLAGYRANFTPERLDESLMTFDGDIPSRVRFATLSAYDGVAFRAADPDQPTGDLTRFERVPYRVVGTSGELHTTHVNIGSYEGAWVPVADEFSQITFSGEEQLALTSGFYFNKSTQTAILKTDRSGGGLLEGDSYSLVYADSDILQEGDRKVSQLGPAAAGSVRPNEEDLPDLYQWLRNQQVRSATVAEVIRLRDRLMERSYLGRSKAEPVGEDTWMPEDYIFRSSDAGENLDRINKLFTNMLDPRYRPCANPTDQCAAHVGDEEQYAAATALIARAVGFPSRVVYGAKVRVDGTVTGSDATVWTEIQTSGDTWVALDVVPRVDNAFIEQPDEDSYRQYNPATDQKNADVVDPPAKEPSTIGQEEDDEEPETEDNVFLSYVVLGLKVLGVLALVTSPIWGILLAKLLRRRSRRRKGEAVDKVLGGWREYVDRIADAGGTVDASATRSEIAADHGEGASALAVGADYAAFSGQELTDKQAENYWERVEEERRALVADFGLLAKLKTRLSPKSFGHYRKKQKDAAARRRFRLRGGREKVEQ